MRLLGIVFVVAATSACDQPLSPTVMSGLSGIVVRGPVTPVCRVEVPCAAPFSADFSVEQGTTRVAQFRSDADGRFAVRLAPGVYRVVPGPDAPIIAPTRQAKTVEVLPAGLTEVRLQFDTGIR